MKKDPELQNEVPVQIGEKRVHVAPGTPIGELLEPIQWEQQEPYLGALLNNRLTGLDEPLWGPSQCRGVTIQDGWMGASIYRRSAALILFEACRELYPDLHLETGQALGNGYHFLLHGQIPTEEGWIQALMQRCHELIQQQRSFQHKIVNIEKAKAIFDVQESHAKSLLLRTWHTDLVHLVTLGQYHDIQHGPVAPTTGHIHPFTLTPFPPGFVLEFEDVVRIGFGNQAHEQKKLFQAYRETREWNRVLGVSSVGQLNQLALDGGVRDIIRISEGFHEKKIAQIADIISTQTDKRLILIAGPSSAGKTTFAKRLMIQLRVNGLKPVSISLDDYYLNHEQMPQHPDGRLDFEALEALDVPLFNEHLRMLLDGQTIQRPVFHFPTGKRLDASHSHPLSLDDDQILLLEGIHGLNPKLTQSVADDSKFKIFINALTQLNLDRSNRLFTSETRLLRRIVRDRRYRGHSASRTIDLWPSVRDGERKYIFPFQESADVMFNSTLLYEPSVLSSFAERYLLEVPRDHHSAAFAYRLRAFLQLFVPILPHDVPNNSILREFIGEAKNY